MLLFLAIFALSTDIVLKFLDSSRALTCEKGTDSDKPIQDSDDDTDDEAREFKLFFEAFGTACFTFELLVMAVRDVHIAPFTEYPLQSPPFSPPEWRN